MTEDRSAKRFAALVMVMLVLSTGCAEPTRAVSPDDAQLRFVARLLIDYSRTNGVKNPKSTEDFVSYLEANKAKWESAGLFDAESLLTSPRDGKQLVIVPNSQVGPKGPSLMPIIAFEKDGLNDVHKAINQRGAVIEISKGELESLFPNLK